MDREFSEFISNVLDKTDIVNLISRYVRTERKGNTYWACCPFHNESQPSFAINAQKQFFHCFGCKESGNAITFLMKLENIEFMDALKMLAEQAGMEMPKFSGSGERVDKKLRETLYNLMRDAARHYHDNLSNPRAKIFRDYLEERQIPQAMITRFGLGASLDFTEMLDFLKSKGYTYEQIHAAGIAETKDGRQYDVFGKRLMYPIIDNMGHVVAFGGRTLEKDVHFAKYRNSTQTEIFDKSKVIYAINLLKKRKAQKPIDYVIMTEGYMDVIALHKAGFDTAVASMGTALTVKQARQLKLYSDRVYISYDGDTAGQKATLRGLDILRESGLTVKVVRLPDGLDPDDLIKRDGREAYQKLLDEAIPLTAYKIDVLMSRYDLSDPDMRAKFAIEAVEVINSLQTPIEREQYLTYISEKTGFSLDALKRQAMVSSPPEPTSRQPEPDEAPLVAAPVEYDANLKFFLACIVQGCDFVDFEYDVTGAMPDGFSKRLYALCRENGGGAHSMIFEQFDGEDRAKLNELMDYKFIPGDGKEKFSSVEVELYVRILKRKQDELNDLYKSTKNNEYLLQSRDISVEITKLTKFNH